jgi:hypothetical protein
VLVSMGLDDKKLIDGIYGILKKGPSEIFAEVFFGRDEFLLQENLVLPL